MMLKTRPKNPGSLTTSFQKKLLWLGSVADQVVARVIKSKALIVLNYLLILFLVLMVFCLCLYHNPHFDYDESNTLRIARQPIGTIHQILKNEQNLPLYYQVIHYLIKWSGGNDRAVVWFNFSVWLVSIGVFYFLIRLFFTGRQTWNWLLFYLLTPTIYYYAFYCRPYGLINLSFLVFLVSFIIYLRKGQFTYLIIAGLALSLLPLLHPMGLLAALLVVLISFWLVGNRKHFLSFLFILSFSVLISLFQLADKTDWYRIFFSVGTEYVRDHRLAFFDFISLLFFYDKVGNLLFFKSAENFSLVLWLLGVYLVWSTAKNRQFLKKDQWVLLSFSLVYILLSLTLAPVFGRQRHLIFFLPPLLTTFFLGLRSLPAKKANCLRLGLLMIFLMANVRMLGLFWSKEKSYYRHCLSLKNVQRGVVVTSYTAHNAVTECLDPKKVKLLLINENGLIDISRMSELQLLLLQAKSGGTMIENTNLRFRNQFDQLLLSTEGRSKTTALLQEAAQGHDDLYLVYSNQGRVTQGDLRLIGEDFRLYSVLNPTIFWFKRVK